MKSRLPAALILDVEHTLFDWMNVWYPAFSALLDTLVSAAVANSNGHADPAEIRRALVARFRALYRQHGSTEYPFALAELSTDGDLLRAAAARYREAAETAAEAAGTVYPLVRETLAWFRLRGTVIVAVTETRLDVAGPRLRRLGLDGFVDMLYAPEPWTPRSIDADLALWPHGLPPLDATIARPVFGHVKPQPALLRVILADLDVLPDEALYVGDSLEMDVAMARAAHVPAVWARYGTVRAPEALALLHEVCHEPMDASASASARAAHDDELEPRPVIIDGMAELQARYTDDAQPDHARGDRHRTAGRS